MKICIPANFLRLRCEKICIYRIRGNKDSLGGDTVLLEIFERSLARHDESAALLHELFFQCFDAGTLTSMIFGRAFNPKQKRDIVISCPGKRAPRGEIVVASADNHIRCRAPKGRSHTPVEQEIL